MPIEDRNLKPGTRLVGRYHKQSYSCEVIEGEGSKLCYRLGDGRVFKSPSAAGMAITGHACDGWVFWSVETVPATPATDPLEPQEESLETQQVIQTAEATEGESKQPGEAPAPTTVLVPAAEEPNPTKKGFFRTPNQKGVTEGQVRWYCHDCGKSFLTATGQTPQSCPQGHKIA